MEKEFLGNYKIIRKVGEGGMAIAYLAHHKQIADHKVILKLLKDPRHGEKFKKEANNLARLNDNSHICRIFDFFNDEERTVIVMEYIEGASLKEVIESEKQLPLNLSLKLGVDLLRVMKYAHNRKMYHRDIKPGNLMVDKQGEMRVIDFGIAKDANDPNETAAGVFSGTPMFAPLEQFDPMRKVDWAKADIYAIGTTLFRMLTGRMPFDGSDWDEYSENKRLAEPFAPSSFNSEVSPELDAVILKSIARLPEDRYNNIDEMLQQFEKLRSDKISGVGHFDRTMDVDDPNATYVPPAPITVPPKFDTPLPVQKKSKTKLIVTAAFLVVAVPLGLYLYFGVGLWFATKKKGVESNIPNIVAADTIQNQPDSLGAISSAQPSDNFKTPNDVKPPVKLTPGTVAMTIEPIGDIYLNNEKIADRQTGYNLDISPGDHSLRIVNSDSDYDSTIVQEFKITAAETKNFAFSFVKKVLIGHLKVGSWPPKASVSIDGQPQNQVTPTILTLNPGSHTVRVTLPDRSAYRESTLVVSAGDTVKFAPEFE